MTTYKFTLNTSLPMPRLLTRLARLGDIEAMSKGATTPAVKGAEKAPKPKFNLADVAAKGRAVIEERRLAHQQTLREIVTPFLQTNPRASAREVATFLTMKGFRSFQGNRYNIHSVWAALRSAGIWAKKRGNTWDRGPVVEGAFSPLPEEERGNGQEDFWHKG